MKPRHAPVKRRNARMGRRGARGVRRCLRMIRRDARVSRGDAREIGAELKERYEKSGVTSEIAGKRSGGSGMGFRYSSVFSGVSAMVRGDKKVLISDRRRL